LICYLFVVDKEMYIYLKASVNNKLFNKITS
jgi:hypothetical protein